MCVLGIGMLGVLGVWYGERGGREIREKSEEWRACCLSAWYIACKLQNLACHLCRESRSTFRAIIQFIISSSKGANLIYFFHLWLPCQNCPTTPHAHDRQKSKTTKTANRTAPAPHRFLHEPVSPAGNFEKDKNKNRSTLPPLISVVIAWQWRTYCCSYQLQVCSMSNTIAYCFMCGKFFLSWNDQICVLWVDLKKQSDGLTKLDNLICSSHVEVFYSLFVAASCLLFPYWTSTTFVGYFRVVVYRLSLYHLKSFSTGSRTYLHSFVCCVACCIAFAASAVFAYRCINAGTERFSISPQDLG